MTSQSLGRVGDDYVLPTGEDDQSCLDTIHAVYGSVSLRGLEAARIGEASRVADMGCGTGTVSRWMAKRIGPAGRVDAIDIAPEQVDIARSTPVSPGAGQMTTTSVVRTNRRCLSMRSTSSSRGWCCAICRSRARLSRRWPSC